MAENLYCPSAAAAAAASYGDSSMNSREPRLSRGSLATTASSGLVTIEAAAAAAGSTSKGAPTVEIPQGKVSSACREWLVREDGVLAHRLQDEEINSHYQGNRNKNQIVRQDFRKARSLQMSEEERLTLERLRLEESFDRQAQRDELVALEIQERILEEERRKLEDQKAREAEDERLARRLQDKERRKLIKRRLERELAEVEHIRTEKIYDLTTTATPPDRNHSHDQLRRTPSAEQDSDYANLTRTLDRMRVDDSTRRYITMRFDHLREMDLSEFCQPPPPGLDPEALRSFYEQQDEELAQFLQEQETRAAAGRHGAGRTGRRNPRDKKSLIEAQDYEIAKILQEQENEKARKLKEKVRQRRRQERNSQREAAANEANEGRNSLARTQSGFTSYVSESEMLPQDQHPVDDDADHHHNHQVSDEERIPSREDFAQLPDDDDDEENGNAAWLHEPLYDRVPDTPEPEEGARPASDLQQSHQATSPSPAFHSYNVAIDLDPTYNRRAYNGSGAQSSGSGSTNRSGSQGEQQHHHPKPPRSGNNSCDDPSPPPPPNHHAAPVRSPRGLDLDDLDDPTTLIFRSNPRTKRTSGSNNEHSAVRQHDSNPEHHLSAAGIPQPPPHHHHLPNIGRSGDSDSGLPEQYRSWPLQPIPGQRRSTAFPNHNHNHHGSHEPPNGKSSHSSSIPPPPPPPPTSSSTTSITANGKRSSKASHSRDGCKTQ